LERRRRAIEISLIEAGFIKQRFLAGGLLLRLSFYLMFVVFSLPATVPSRRLRR